MARNKVEDFEELVFRKATLFRAVLFQPRGMSKQHEYPTFKQATDKAATLRDEHGRTGMVYAISPDGRSVCISRSEWARYCRIEEELTATRKEPTYGR